ncbi:MAG: LysR family transcriptional regulator [Oceanospirillum sp.]|nr:LysR family transcriptional regulator [Oceanospirillum sp.]
MAGHKTTLEQWRILQAVVDHGGYAQAAEALFRSQSSLNHAVKKMESQLGVQLLEVKGRKAFLTEAGEALLRRSRVLTETASELEKLAENIDMGWEPQLTLAVEAIYPRDLLFKALASFYPESRGTRIRIIDSVLTGTDEHILAQSADLAVAGTVPKGHTGETLGQIEFVMVVHKSHELALDSRLSLQPLKEEQIEGKSSDEIYLGAVADRQQSQPSHKVTVQELMNQLQIVIKDSGQKPDNNRGWLRAEQRWTVDSFERAKQILKRGLGFCWLPRHEIVDEIASGEFVVIDISYSSERYVGVNLVVPNPDLLGPGGRRLYEILLQEGQIAQA